MTQTRAGADRPGRGWRRARPSPAAGGPLAVIVPAAGAMLAVIALGVASGAPAQEVVRASPDVTITVGDAAILTRDDQVAVDDRLGTITPEALIGIPESAEVTAYSRVGDSYAVAFESWTELPGGLVVRPGDVAVYDATNAAYSIVFDGSGLPPGTHVDAVSFLGSALLLSFDRRVELGFIVDDEDVVRWADGTTSLVLDGSAVGLDPAVDVDAVQALAKDALLLSFDTTGSVGGIVFRDEDVVRFEHGVWSLEYAAAAGKPEWIAADLDAMTVPEPGPGALSAAGALALAAAAGRRRRRLAGVCGSAVAGLAIAVLWPPPDASASEGRLEISHTCATVSGCGPGDAPGYPVTITSASRRSLVLTSNLVVPDTSTTAIEIQVNDVTVDLAGFSILRSDCVGATVACTPATSTNGGILAVDSGTPGFQLLGARVHGGNAIGFTDGVAVGRASEVSNVRARWNRFIGVGTVGGGSAIFDSTARENGQYGITTGTLGRALAVGNRSAQNAVGVLGGGDGQLILDTVVFENDLAGIFMMSSTNLFVGNAAYGNGGNGLEVQGGVAAVIEGNTTYDNSGGIVGRDGAIVRGNVARGHASFGLLLGPNAGYRENTLTDNAGGDVSSGIGINLGDNACSGGGGAIPCP